MSVFPGFGGWIDQTIQQPPKAESKRSENSKSKSVPETRHNHESEETKKQLKLWRDQEKMNPWYDYPPKVKVKTEKGECHMTIQCTVGLPPEAVFDIITSHDNQTYSYFPMMMKGRKFLANISKKVINDNGPQEKLMEVEKAAEWKFLWWSGTIPIYMSFNENRNEFVSVYTLSRKRIIMKTLKGKWKVEPWYVHNDRYCKPRQPKSREEYTKCSGGQGLVASRVTLLQSFEPLFPFNLPPIVWLIRKVIIKNTKSIVENVQIRGAVLRSV